MSALRLAMASVAIGFAAAGGYLAHHSAPPAPSVASAPADTTNDELSNLREHVGQMERALVTNQARLASLEATPGDAGSAPPRDVAARRPPSPEEASAREARQLAEIDARVSTEPRDAQWAPAYEASLRDTIAASTHGSAAPKVDTLSCRTSVCRLELAYASADAQQDFLHAFPSHRPPMTAAHWENVASSDGSIKTRIDVVREGYPMPGAEELER
jgi:hypothetical protein